MTKSPPASSDELSFADMPLLQALRVAGGTTSSETMRAAACDLREGICDALAANGAITPQAIGIIFKQGPSSAKKSIIQNNIKNSELDLVSLIIETEDLDLISCYIRLAAVAAGSFLDESEGIMQAIYPSKHEMLLNILSSGGFLMEGKTATLTFAAKAIFMFMATSQNADFLLPQARILASNLQQYD